MKLYFTVVAILLFTVSMAQHGHDVVASDKPSTHGMLIFGKEKIYASHLPLFHTPHDYQIILELELTAADKKKFIADQQQHPEFTTYTIEPEKFVLPDMIAKPRPFTINIYRGHFERGGTVIMKQVTVTIKQVIYFKKFNSTDAKDADAKYILFGNSKEKFAVHRISNKPDFEQIIMVQTNNAAPQKFETIICSEKNAPLGVSGNTIETADKRKLTLLKQLYLEFDDLKD
jgi:hypothetical protein